MRLSVVLFALTLGLVYLLTPLSAESPGRPEEGWIESFRADAARQSIIARWSATVGRENIYLTFREDGTVRLADREGTWTVAGARLALVIEDEPVNYRYELLENYLTLSEGDLIQPLRFTRMGSGTGFLQGYRAWFGMAFWKSMEERVYRILSVLGIVIAAVLLLNILRSVSQFLIFNDWGPFAFIYRRNKSRTRTIHSVTLNILKYLIFFTALGHILNDLGINYTTYIASLSVIGLAIGFGSQGLVQDIVTGFFLLFDGQFSVGDMVEISGQTGIVEEMGLRTTRLRNYIGQSVVIPNRNIALVGNYSKGCLEA
ncbi:MAG: mechanosensitive ion channel [Opitutales bacterium]|nr:mechanosensitive ion channel [Opitutales bacterium]